MHNTPARLVERVLPAASYRRRQLYGIEGQGWFLGIHTYTHYVKVAYFHHHRTEDA